MASAFACATPREPSDRPGLTHTTKGDSMRSSEEYDELLAGFHALNVQVGRRLFDLRWHHVSRRPADEAADQTQPRQKPKLRMLCLSLPDKDGGWRDVQWVEPPGSASKKRRSTKTPRPEAKDAPAENWPVILTKRQVVGQLCLPLDDQGERFTLGLADFVTIPRGGSAAEALSDGKGTVGDRFRKLSARAGEALPYQWKECLRGFVSVFDDDREHAPDDAPPTPAPAIFWYALLFAAYGHPRTAAGPGGVPEEVHVHKPLSYSADLIERLGLNTDCPKLPEDLASSTSAKGNQDGTGDGKPPEAPGEPQPGADESRLPCAPSSVAELPRWIREARELLRGQEDYPISESATANAVRKQFLEHLEALFPNWAALYRSFQPHSFRTARELVAMMADIGGAIESDPPSRRVVTGFGVQLEPPEPPIETEARHSEDFSSVVWFGSEYSFTKTQAACVRVLWEAWEQKTPDLKEETILERAGSEGSRLRDVFKSKGGMHAAWGTMIVPAGKGRFRLKEPEEPAPPAKPQENPA